MDCRALIALCERTHQLRCASLRRVLSRRGLHIGQPAMLAYIRAHPGCSQREIADHAHVTPASIAASVKRLEKGGLLLRRGDTADTRCNRVYLTPLGERELLACTEALDAEAERVVKALTEEEYAQFCACLQKICGQLRDTEAKTP